MKLTFTAAALCLALALPAAAATSFPTSGLEARSLGRGGTVIAAPGGLHSVLGNPATLVPSGQFQIVAQYLRDPAADDSSWVLGVADTSSHIKGAALYVDSPAFAGFEDSLWGVALAQSLGGTITIGESVHYGSYVDPATSTTEDVYGADLGLLLSVKGRLALGYVARNVYRSDEDLLDQTSGYGLRAVLPLDIDLTVDYEENAATDDMDMRAGAEFPIWGPLTGAAGYREPAAGATIGTTGLAWHDQNGSVEIAVSYDLDNDKMTRIVWGFNINY